MPSKLYEAIKNPKKALRVAPERFNVFLGKIIFNNAAGFTRNIYGIKSRAIIKNNKLKYSFNKNTNPYVNEFKINGHGKLGNIYDASMIERISSEFGKIIENENISSPTSKFNNKVYSRYVPLVHKHIPEITNLITPEIIDLFEQYYEGSFQILDIYAYRIYNIPKEIAENNPMYSNEWHCDGHDTTWTKLFVYLTDVSEEDGPFNTQSIERTRELIKKGFGDRTNYKLPREVLDDPAYSVKYVGPKGTALVCNTELCLHRATIPGKNRFRDLVMFQFAPSTKPLPYDWASNLKGNVSKVTLDK